MVSFSANLGFLWTELPLPDAIRAAARAGFDAVECHFPYETDPEALREALYECGLPLLGINTRPGNLGTFGLAALPEQVLAAREAIDEAVEYAREVEAQAVHVMAGVASGPDAQAVFVENLRYAVQRAGEITLLIEPLNAHDVPGYFLATLDDALAVIEEVPEVRLMFDCYHVARTEGDVLMQFERLRPLVGHIQFAGVPDRGDPARGTLDYRAVFAAIEQSGWSRPLGAEYRPAGSTEDSLGWMTDLRTAS